MLALFGLWYLALGLIWAIYEALSYKDGWRPALLWVVPVAGLIWPLGLWMVLRRSIQMRRMRRI